MVDRKTQFHMLEALFHNGATLHEKLGAYCAMNGLTIQQDLTPGEILRNRIFATVLVEAKARLSSEDQLYIKDVPIILSDRRWAQAPKMAVMASATYGPDAPTSITFYRSMITSKASWEKYTHEQYVDWVYRLFLHEIGHARDKRTDAEMAKTSGY